MDGKSEILRIQLINNTLQGMMNVHDPSKSYLQYQALLNPVVEKRYQSGNVLVLGLGAGLIYNLLGSNKDLHFDFIEIDKGVAHSAQKYFIGNQKDQENLNIVIDDARHYVEHTEEKYDLIIVDTFAGENVPAHVLTLESLSKIRSLLLEDGLLVVNFHGNWGGKKGRGARSLYKTIEAADYEVEVAATGRTDGIQRSLLFLCAQEKIGTFGGIEVPKSTAIYETVKSDLASYFLETEPKDLEDAVALTDDKQQLEHLLREVCLDWRRYSIKNYVQPTQKESGRFFY